MLHLILLEQKFPSYGSTIFVSMSFFRAFFAVQQLVTSERFQQRSRIPNVQGVMPESLQTIILWSNDCTIPAIAHIYSIFTENNKLS